MESIFQYLAEILQAVGEGPIALAALMFVLLAVLASLLFKNSKGLSGICAFIALLAFAFFLVITFNKVPSPVVQKQTTNPLQVGKYMSFNYQLNVFQKGERICIRTRSDNGSTVASVHVAPNNPNLYQPYQYSGMSLMQVNSTTISFGERDYIMEGKGFPQSIPDVEQKCLDSTIEFFEHTPVEGRGRGAN